MSLSSDWNPHPPAAPQPLVLIVDDEAPMRAALRRLLLSADLAAEAFDCGDALLAAAPWQRGACILLDMKMPGMSGLEVQRELNRLQVELPVIFLTGAGDVPKAVAAMHAGAADFIEKPFDNGHLLERVRQAIASRQQQREQSDERGETRRRLARLTPRELQVLEQVVAGRTSKEIARILGASHRTIEIHRTHLMEKMAAASLADLVRMRLRVGGG